MAQTTRAKRDRITRPHIPILAVMTVGAVYEDEHAGDSIHLAAFRQVDTHAAHRQDHETFPWEYRWEAPDGLTCRVTFESPDDA